MAYPGFHAENALVPSKIKYRGKNLYGGGGSVSPQSDIDGDGIEDFEDDTDEEDIDEDEI